MARPLRIEFPGALYHITTRGNRRETIYLRDSDRVRFLEILGKASERFHWRCLAYCLMGNHYHLVIETLEANLAAGMRHLNGVYTQEFNRQHRRVGHVFQGRYKAILVDKDRYLQEVCRYVILNPVRAGLVRSAGQWRWSSYREMIGRRAVPDWMDIDQVLSQFGIHLATARRRYIDFIKAGHKDGGLWRHLRQQLYLGDEQFVSGLLTKLDCDRDLTEIPTPQRRLNGVSLAVYARSHIDEHPAMAAAYASGDYTLKVIGDYFDVHYSTVSRAVQKYGYIHVGT